MMNERSEAAQGQPAASGEHRAAMADGGLGGALKLRRFEVRK